MNHIQYRKKIFPCIYYVIAIMLFFCFNSSFLYAYDIQHSDITGGAGFGTGNTFQMRVSTAQSIPMFSASGNYWTLKNGKNKLLTGASFSPPVANAGSDQTVDEDNKVWLNAELSYDPANLVITYKWEQIEGPAVSLSDQNIIDPFFIVPQVNEDGVFLSFRLIVTNSMGLTDQDTINIYINQLSKSFVIRSSASDGGSISPANNVTIKEGSDIAFSILANTNYDIVDLLVDGNSLGSLSSFTFFNVKQDHIIHAVFKPRPVITASAGQNGNIEPSGSIILKNESDRLFYFKANQGYRISDVIIDGQSLGDISFYFFESVKENHSIHVLFEKAVYYINAESSTNGHIEPQGLVEVIEGKDLNFKIIPDFGYELDELRVNGEIVEAQSSYTFFKIFANQSINVSFKPMPKIQAYAEEHGSIEPSGTVYVNEGSYEEFIIKANAGYRIKDVFVDGVPKGAISSYIFSKVNIDHIISVTFIKAPFINTITILANEGGEISPNNELSVLEIYQGNNAPFIITANEGYSLSTVIIDGVNIGPVPAYTFTNVNDDHQIQAVFEKVLFFVDANVQGNGSIDPAGRIFAKEVDFLDFNIFAEDKYKLKDLVVNGESLGSQTYYYIQSVKQDYSITAIIEPADFIINASAGLNGKITPSGPVAVNENAGQTFNIEANEGYEINEVFIDALSVGAIPLYTFWKVSEAHSISASFNQSPYIVAFAGENGFIEPSGQVPVLTNGFASFSIKPSISYAIQDVIVDGVSMGPIERYVFWDVQEDHTISAQFKKFDITALQTANGKILPEGIYKAGPGETATFSIVPDTGYILDDVLVDNISVGALPIYNFFDISADHNISAIFSQAAQFVISLTAENGGSISPSGVNSQFFAYEGTYEEFVFKADSGYEISDVKIDNISIGAKNKYIFSDISEHHSISVSFKALENYNISAYAKIGGSISPSGNLNYFAGAYETFYISPSEGYYISDLIVDGISKGKLKLVSI